MQHTLCSGICTTLMPCAQVLAHLKAETAYTEAALADTEALQQALYKELRGRIQARPVPAHASG